MAAVDDCVKKYKKCIKTHPGPQGQWRCLAQLMGCIAAELDRSLAASQSNMSPPPKRAPKPAANRQALD